jgi:peroxiredoxin
MIRKKWLAILGIALIVASVSGYSLAHFARSRRASSSAASVPAQPRVDRSVPELRSAVGKPLPEAILVDRAGTQLSDEQLRHGKVVLVFLSTQCGPCTKEGEFLRSVMNRRQDVSFYGIVSLGEKDAVLQESEKLFPFKTFFDKDALLANNFGIARVPIKVFLEDGVVKQTWGGASKSEEVQADFIEWLDRV